LESDTEERYWVWFRWGRVGYKGQTSLVPCGANLPGAKSLFCNKFVAKTMNDWGERASFVKVAGKMRQPPLIKTQKQLKAEIKLLEALSEIGMAVRTFKKESERIDIHPIDRHYMNMQCEISVLPDDDPQMRQPPLIKTQKQLKAEIKLLEALSEIGMAVRTFKKESERIDIHPIDRHYMNMQCEISVLPDDDPQYKLVADYLEWTHAPTHNMYKVHIRTLYAICRNGEKERFMSHLGNRLVLSMFRLYHCITVFFIDRCNLNLEDIVKNEK
uniref:NAD(+) ADP-ribosyltransferase n=1 Tax=Gongylonema pulchrum TaxID=637853 RepID=A0A183EDU4_9BILA